MSNYEELFKLAKAAAKRVSFQWPSNIQEDDLTQDIVVRLMESPTSIDRLFEEDEITRKAFMVKVAHQVASDEQTDYDRFSGNYLYDTVEVRALLEEKAWLQDLPNLSAEIFDLKEAMHNLASRSSGHYAEIVNRFEHEIIPDRLEKTEHSRISRAVTALTEEMNLIGARRRKGRIEGPGSRTAISNAAAHVITWNQYGGEFDREEYIARNL